MSKAEQIYIKAKTLPDSAQEVVLNFVEMLSNTRPSEDSDWSKFSLASAMEGMEDESWPDLTAAKTFEKWP